MKVITEHCTGCTVCRSKCPVSAIDITDDKNGFYKASINDKCKNCGLCTKICPQNNYENFGTEKQIVYAVKASDEIREKSSSGGIFSLLAENVIQNGGYVCGAAFDEDFKSVSHIIIDKIDDIGKLRTSKYLQSNIGNVFKEIEQLLNNNKQVLFSGTPCQVAGLKNFLGKNYDNLLTVDILCHGVPSPKVWKKYIEVAAGKNSVLYANFRDKKYGWTPFLHLKLSCGDEVEETSGENLYYRAFLENLSLNDSCYSCKYTRPNRVGDITLGDFWGIEKFDKKLADKRGVSLVILNNKKAAEVFRTMRFLYCKEVPISYAINGNPVLSSPSTRHYNREIFFGNLENKNILSNIHLCLSNRIYEGVITNLWYSNNYGAILSAYAIQNYFKENNFDFKILNFVPPRVKQKSFVKNFKEKYLDLTHPVITKEDFAKLNIMTNNFVVGTDQVFRYEYICTNIDKFLLSYTDFSKKRIAFSASFGIEHFNECNEKTKYILGKYFKRFDAISTREDSGVNICKNDFDIDAKFITDPVFLVNKSLWENLDTNKDFKNKYQNKIVSYIFDSGKEVEQAYKYLSSKYNTEIETIAGKDLEVEEFVAAIKNCRYFVTDSFHGACFALIFNKRFVCIKNKSRGTSRFNSLIRLFDIGRLFVHDITDIYEKADLFSDYDFEKVEEKIEEHRIIAKEFLNEAFNKPKNVTNNLLVNELDVIRTKNIEKIFFKDSDVKFPEKIFSIKNESLTNREYKIIRILGIKIKFGKKSTK